MQGLYGFPEGIYRVTVFQGSMLRFLHKQAQGVDVGIMLIMSLEGSIYLFVYLSIYLSIYLYIHVHTHMYVYIYIYTHTYIYIYIEREREIAV